MDEPATLFPPSPFCDRCPLAHACGAAFTDSACRESRGPGDPGGPNALGPLSPDLTERIEEVGGLEFDDIHAAPVELPALPDYLPQLPDLTPKRWRYLDRPLYGVRLGKVLRARDVASADEVRERVGLKSEQGVVLVLFDADPLLERAWRPEAAAWMAGAGYEMVVTPSFSTWVPWPIPETLRNLKRSMWYFQALLDAGAPVIPRIGWVTEREVHRAARWLERYPVVRTVAIDLQTYKSNRDFTNALAGLRLLDHLTGRRLRYVINGPGTLGRFVALREVAAGRLTITNATGQVALRPTRRVRSPLLLLADPGQRLAAQIDNQDWLLARAARSMPQEIEHQARRAAS